MGNQFVSLAPLHAAIEMNISSSIANMLPKPRILRLLIYASIGLSAINTRVVSSGRKDGLACTNL